VLPVSPAAIILHPIEVAALALPSNRDSHPPCRRLDFDSVISGIDTVSIPESLESILIDTESIPKSILPK
jgi:hypothetical protein